MTNALVVVLKGYPRLSETFIAQELLGLERAGFRLHLVALRRPNDPKVHPIHQEIRADVSYLCEYLHREPRRVWRSFRQVRRTPGYRRARKAFLRDLVRDPTPNRVRRFGQALVLAAEWPHDGAYLYAHFIHTPASVTRYAGMMLGVPWACSAHAKDIWTAPDWDIEAKLADADWVVTCTKAGRDRLAAIGPSDNVRLLYHGLDLERFEPHASPRPLRDGSDPKHPVLLLTVGRAVEKKGLDVLLDALAGLPARLHWRWAHVGGGPLLAALKEKGRELGLGERIEWFGPLDQPAVLDRYRTADIVVLASRIAHDGDRDGLPNVLMEAQSQAVACLSTRVSAIPELVENEITGLLVAPDNRQELADGLARLIADPALRRRLGKAGAFRVRNSFDHRRGIDRLAGMFEASGLTRAVVREAAAE